LSRILQLYGKGNDELSYHLGRRDSFARCYGIRRERIRQIEARGLLKLRQPNRSQRLAGFQVNEAVEESRPAAALKGPSSFCPNTVDERA
jgi:hypothetical protein